MEVKESKDLTSSKDITPSPECLEKLHVQIDKKIASGTRGSIWTIDNQPERALKFTKNTERDEKKASIEESIAQYAASLGIGPPISSVSICQGHYYIVMKKLSGPSLEELYPFDSSYIDRALDLYYKLLQNGVIQNDFHAGNLILDGKRLYLIDYGDASFLSEKPDFKMHMEEAIDSLLGNLYNFTDDNDPILEYQQVAKTWIKTRF